MRLLDACCKAGGASDGYASAGWQVTGIDIEPQPNYPYRFILGDALEYIWEHGAEYDAIHASWPCQKFTAYRRKGHGVGEGYLNLNLIPQGRVALISTGKPWIMENVAGAPLRRPVQPVKYDRHHFESDLCI
jgi:DNA (cytosine-5)-methyltransferase 1